MTQTRRNIFLLLFSKPQFTHKSVITALAINKNIWPSNGSHTLNMQSLGLMFNNYFDLNNSPPLQSDHYGYPNLGRPNNHFDITPFEAIYADPQTYQHIKMQKSVDDDNLDEAYLVHTRNFILDEVEADIVYLQNKTIGKNHVQWDPNYRYKAWYKAYDQIIFSEDESPKTDPGPFIIEETGEVTAYACKSVTMYPGFHAQQGGKYHTYVHCDGCSRPREQGMYTNDGENNQNRADEKQSLQTDPFDSEDNIQQKAVLNVYPNPSDKGFTIEFPIANGDYIISNTNGKRIKESKVLSKTIFIELPKGIYFLKWMSSNGMQTKKIIAL